MCVNTLCGLVWDGDQAVVVDGKVAWNVLINSSEHIGSIAKRVVVFVRILAGWDLADAEYQSNCQLRGSSIDHEIVTLSGVNFY